MKVPIICAVCTLRVAVWDGDKVRTGSFDRGRVWSDFRRVDGVATLIAQCRCGATPAAALTWISERAHAGERPIRV